MGLDTRGWKRGVWRGGWWGRQGLDQLGTGGSNWGPSLIFQRSWEMQMKPLLDAKLTWIRVSTQGTHRDRNKHILVTPPHPTLWPSFCPLSPNYLSPQWVNLIKDIICIWRFLFLQRFMIESFQKRKPALIENVLCARCCSINWKKKNKKQTEKNFVLKYKLVLQFRASAYRLMSFTNWTHCDQHPDQETGHVQHSRYLPVPASNHHPYPYQKQPLTQILTL